MIFISHGTHRKHGKFCLSPTDNTDYLPDFYIELTLFYICRFTNNNHYFIFQWDNIFFKYNSMNKI